MRLALKILLLSFFLPFSLLLSDSSVSLPFEESLYRPYIFSEGGIHLVKGKFEEDQILNPSKWGGTLETEYYSEGENEVAGRTVIITPGDLRLGKVKRQTILYEKGFLSEFFGKRALLSEFIYESNGGEKKTKVFTARGGCEIYYFNQKGKLTKKEELIPFEEGTYQIYRTSFYHWDDKGRLQNYYLKNEQGRVLWHHSFTFDSEGRQTQHAFRGNLSGQNFFSLNIDPINGNYLSGGESYFSHRAYLNDGKTLLEWNNRQLVTRKLFDANQVHFATFKEEDGKVIERIFFFYNEKGQLIKEVHDDGCTDDFLNLANVTERKIKLFELNEKHWIVEEKEGFLDLETMEEVISFSKQLSYNSEGEVILEKILDASGALIKKVESVFNETGCLIEQKDNFGRVATYEYDKKGFLKKKFDSKSGIETRYVYNSIGLVTEEIQKNSSGSLRSFIFSFDHAGDLVKKTSFQGHEEGFSFDSLGREIGHIEIPKDAFSQTKLLGVRYFYDEMDCLTKKMDPEGYETHFIYNSRGQVVEILFPDGSLESKIYNLDGSLAQNLSRDGIVTNYSYDAMGRLRRKFSFTKDQKIKEDITYCWGAFHLLSEVNHLGVKTEYAYNSLGQLILQKTIYKEEMLIKEWLYNLKGEMITEKTYSSLSEDEGFLQEMSYHDDGLLASCKMFDFSGRMHASERIWYTSQGEILKKAVAVEDGHEGTKIIEYDGWGRITRIHDEEGRTAFTSWDDTHHNHKYEAVTKKTEVSFNGERVETVFTPAGLEESVKNFDRYGNLISASFFRYDERGSKTTELQENYDENGVRRKKEFTYFYGPVGELLTFVEEEGRSIQKTTHFLYDQNGRMVEKHLPQGGVLYYEYDTLGLLQQLYSSIGDIHYLYEYNEAGEVVKVTNVVTGKETVRSYSSFFFLEGEVLENGLEWKGKKDVFGRVKNLIYPDGSSIAYDYLGLQVEKASRFSAKGDLSYFQQMRLDLKGRVIEKSFPGMEESKAVYTWSKGEKCRRIATPYWHAERVMTEVGDYQAVISDLAGRYDTFASSGLNFNFSIKTIGGRVSYESDIYVKRDSLDRISEVYKSRFSKVEFDRDPFGRVVETRAYSWQGGAWSLDKTLLFGWDESRELGVFSIEKEAIDALIYSGNDKQLMALEIRGKPFGVVQNEGGTLMALIDIEKKVLAEAYRYTATGKRIVLDLKKQERDASLIGNSLGYGLGRMDFSSGLLMFREGVFDPYVGKWVTELENRWADSENFDLEEGLQFWGLFPFLDTPWLSGIRQFVSSVYSSFNSFYNKASQFFRGIGFRSFSGEVTEYIYGKVENLSTKYVGSDFLMRSGLFPNYFSIGTIGNGELHPLVRVTLINGILNSNQTCQDTAQLISSTHGGVNVHYIYNPSGGFAQDILKAFIGKLGFRTYHSKVLAMQWKRLIREMGGPLGGGVVYHYAHSLGGTLTYNARAFLTPDERKIIKVITIGSPTTILSGFGSVTNYSSRLDLIPMFDPIKYFRSIFQETQNIIFMGAGGGGFLSEHLMTGTTYRSLMEELGQEFVSLYGT